MDNTPTKEKTYTLIETVFLGCQECALVFNDDTLEQSNIITAHRAEAPDMVVINGPVYHSKGSLYTFKMNSKYTDCIDDRWLQKEQPFTKVNPFQGT